MSTAPGVNRLPHNSSNSKLVMRVENLSCNVTKEHLMSLMEPLGVIEKIIMPDPIMWMVIPLGRVEVIFASESDAAKVYSHLQGAVIDGSKINIQFVRVEKRLDHSAVGGKRRRSPTPRRRSRSREYRRSSFPKRNRSPPASRRSQRSRSPRSRSPSFSRSSSGSPTWE